ncbi:MAG: hypothetical protein JST84_11630 [Acidobacteria bacterium]|nr:hypothetical protein [Acidobacteriota bacterium]
MQTSHKLTHVLLALAAMVACISTAWAQLPPNAGNTTNIPSTEKPGSMLYYDIYTSKVGDAAQNTRMNMTNTHPTRPVNVHLFFVRKSDCTIADTYLCLTANQTFSFLSSEYDPDETGFLFAVATDAAGVPINHNYLIGDLFVKSNFGTTNYYQANLGAMAFSARQIYRGVVADQWEVWPEFAQAPVADNGTRAFLAYGQYRDPNDATAPHALYDPIPNRLALDNIQSPVDGNNTLLITHSTQGRVDFAGGIGTVIGLVYNDTEKGFSYQTSFPGCLEIRQLNDSTIRIPNGYSKAIPTGRTGWMTLQSATNVAGVPNLGLLGAMIVSNAKSNIDKAAFNGGHSLHFLSLRSNPGFAIPVIPTTTCSNF